MASTVDKLIDLKNYIFGPNINYVSNGSNFNNNVYRRKFLEKWGENGIKLIQIFISLGKYAGPVVFLVFYRKGYFVWDNAHFFSHLSRVLLPVTLALSTAAYAARAIGRYSNTDYRYFYNTLKLAQIDISKHDVKKKLLLYDFDFKKWPVEYTDESNVKRKLNSEVSSHSRSFINSIVYSPCRLVSYIGANYVAIKMVYPGASKIIQSMLGSALLEGRLKLLKLGGERFKIRTQDQNDIDVMFVDRRDNLSEYPNGKTLVICCEGNCGFYEVGIMMTPIEAKYSVLGWNHPGFGGSSGLPFPGQEENAIHAVMEFAINKLGFHPQEIMLYGWSIGGYSSSWAAMNYPDVKGLIIDASFDDILPLALARMPTALHGLIKQIIRLHINLIPWKNVVKYPGPVMFVRRSEDEMITTDQGDVSTNRGNQLVFKVLKSRFPTLISGDHETLLLKWINSEALEHKILKDQYHVDVNLCSSLITSYVQDHPLPLYPMHIGKDLSEEDKNQLVLFLAENYMKEYRSTHCTPLPVNMFRMPWEPEGQGTFYNKL